MPKSKNSIFTHNLLVEQSTKLIDTLVGFIGMGRGKSLLDLCLPEFWFGISHKTSDESEEWQLSSEQLWWLWGSIPRYEIFWSALSSGDLSPCYAVASCFICLIPSLDQQMITWLAFPCVCWVWGISDVHGHHDNYGSVSNNWWSDTYQKVAYQFWLFSQSNWEYDLKVENITITLLSLLDTFLIAFHLLMLPLFLSDPA